MLTQWISVIHLIQNLFPPLTKKVSSLKYYNFVIDNWDTGGQINELLPRDKTEWH